MLTAGELRVWLRLKDEANKQLKSSSRELKQSAQALGADLRRTAMIGAAGLAALSGAMLVTTRAAATEELAEIKLATALKSTGEYTRRGYEQLLAHADALEKVTRFTSAAVLEGEAMLATFKLSPDVIAQVTEAALDLSAATGAQLQSSFILLGKAAVGETGSLKEYGIIVDEAAYKAKGFVAVLEELATEFGGGARAQAKGYFGIIDQIKNAVNALARTIGKELLPAFSSLGLQIRDVVWEVVRFMEQHPILTKTALILAGVVGSITAVGVAAITAGAGILFLAGHVQALIVHMWAFIPLAAKFVGSLLAIKVGAYSAAAAVGLLSLKLALIAGILVAATKVGWEYIKWREELQKVEDRELYLANERIRRMRLIEEYEHGQKLRTDELRDALAFLNLTLRHKLAPQERERLERVRDLMKADYDQAKALQETASATDDLADETERLNKLLDEMQGRLRHLREIPVPPAIAALMDAAERLKISREIQTMWVDLFEEISGVDLMEKLHIPLVEVEDDFSNITDRGFEVVAGLELMERVGEEALYQIGRSFDALGQNIYHWLTGIGETSKLTFEQMAADFAAMISSMIAKAAALAGIKMLFGAMGIPVSPGGFWQSFAGFLGMQAGGITRRTMPVVVHGGEAVIPLDRLERALERFADKIVSGTQGGGTNVLVSGDLRASLTSMSDGDWRQIVGQRIMPAMNYELSR